MTEKFDGQLVPPSGWATPETVRIPPVSRKNIGFSTKAVLSVVEKIGGLDAANLWLMMIRNPRLLRGMMYMASKLMPFGELKRRDTELVILRVAWNCRARYEWGQHVDIGMRAGLTAEDIARIADGPAAAGWTAKQAALLSACDEFHVERMISEATWQQLLEYFDKKLMLELLFLIGFYEGLAGVLNSAGLPLDVALELKLQSLSFQKNKEIQ